MTGPDPGTIDATSTSFDILEYLVDVNDAVGVTQISNDLSMSKSKAYNHLVTLRTLGYVTKRDQKYAPSLQLLAAGMRVRDGLSVYRRGREKVEDLAEAIGETVELFVLEERYAVPVFIASGARKWNTQHRPGERIPLYVSSPGRAILASLPPEDLDEVIETILQESNGEQPFDPGSLKREIREIRESGVAFSREERTPGVISLSSPIETTTADHYAALSIVGPVEELEGRYLEEDLVGHVVSTSQAISVELTK